MEAVARGHRADPCAERGVADRSTDSASPGTTYDPTTGLWSIGNLASGQSVTLQLRVQVVSVEPFTNVARVLPFNQPNINPNDCLRQKQTGANVKIVSRSFDSPRWRGTT